MTSVALTNIGVLMTGGEGSGRGPLGLVDDAALVFDDGVVMYAGPAATAPDGAEERVDVGGRAVMPGFVDSHTHLVFAGDRAGEFVERMAGRAYQPGGIARTVEATRAATADALAAHAQHLVKEARTGGTTTIEIKTGYGLSPEHERIHLEVAAALTEETTFLGAHLVPPEYDRDRDTYLQLLIDVMVPAAAGTAKWCDVFCEMGAFTVDESRRVLAAALAAGLGLRVHANQLGPSGGVALACEMGAASADHCTHLSPTDIDALASTATVATLLPVSDFCTRQPYAEGRALIDAGATVALASNCNPGSSYSTSMPLAIALAVRECGLTVDEALLAATNGGAAALRRPDLGHLTPGARSAAVVLDAPHPHHVAYRVGTPLVWKIV
jgi:imidazolonepropionase